MPHNISHKRRLAAILALALLPAGTVAATLCMYELGSLGNNRK